MMRPIDKHGDVPLFRWSPPTADVVPFPCRRRIGRIRRMADLLIAASTDRARNARWRQTTDAMAEQMMRAGFDADCIAAELEAFHDAVQREIDRRVRCPALHGDSA